MGSKINLINKKLITPDKMIGYAFAVPRCRAGGAKWKILILPISRSEMGSVSSGSLMAMEGPR